MIITISGKGGVGKTTISALLLDELARRGYGGRVLAVDGDPAMTLAMTLGIEPPLATLADIREETPLTAKQLKQLPAGTSPGQHLLDRFAQEGLIGQRQLREMRFDLMAMGHGQGPGCYCRINRALSQALTTIQAGYDLILVDNEAGLEHISRYRLNPIEIFILVMTPGNSALAVADRILNAAETVGLEMGQVWTVYNRMSSRHQVSLPKTLLLPDTPTVASLDWQGGPASALADDHPLRLALAPLVEELVAGERATPAKTNSNS